MSIFIETNNPFTVTTPEDISAQHAYKLFVDVFSDFPKIPKLGHVFLNGPRGSGKSMIFRYLQPDCQCISKNCKTHSLQFLSIYIPIKNTTIAITEFRRLEGQHADFVLNEHFMIMFIINKTFSTLLDLLRNNYIDETNQNLSEIKEFSSKHFANLLKLCGWSETEEVFNKSPSFESCLQELLNVSNKLYMDTLMYLKKLAFANESLPYNGPLCGFIDFLYPLFCELKNLSFMPKDRPIFLLIDDADNLNITQTQILNSWVGTRTSTNLSLKISTQLRYKSYFTTSGYTIDTPHDYTDVNISTIYTTSKRGTYKNRIREIVVKRMDLYSLTDISPEEFFPPDEKQEAEIERFASEIRSNWGEEGRGYRASDDVARYARPNYIRSLAGSSKNSPTYSYSGFEQLVHISSGIIRHFLEPAAIMYSEVYSLNSSNKVSCIPSSIQDRVIRAYSDDFLFKEFEKMYKDKSPNALNKDLLTQLFNLISALGGIFREILLSDRSERRVFSIAISDSITQEVKDVLDLGIHLGYFHLAAIGNKEGTGRTQLYILNRRLAPYFKLDPTSFAGYLFITNNVIKDALSNPKLLLGRIKRKGMDAVIEERQLALF